MQGKLNNFSFGPNGPKWTKTDQIDRSEPKRTKVVPKGPKQIEWTKMDQSGPNLKKNLKKNPPYTRFSPLYTFDIENEVKNVINYVS